jgi:hypothetical protein
MNKYNLQSLHLLLIAVQRKCSLDITATLLPPLTCSFVHCGGLDVRLQFVFDEIVIPHRPNANIFFGGVGLEIHYSVHVGMFYNIFPTVFVTAIDLLKLMFTSQIPCLVHPYFLQASRVTLEIILILFVTMSW